MVAVQQKIEIDGPDVYLEHDGRTCLLAFAPDAGHEDTARWLGMADRFGYTEVSDQYLDLDWGREVFLLRVPFDEGMATW